MKSLFLLFIFCLTLFSKPLTPITLQLKWKYQFQFAGYIIAKEKGFYKDLGLDVNVREYSHGKPSLKEVKKGNAQFGIGSADLIIHRLNKGTKYLQMFALCQASPLMLATTKESGIEKLEDLKGKNILMYNSKGFVSSVYSMLKSKGMDIDDFNFVQSKLYSPKEITNGTADFLPGYSTITPYQIKKMGFTPITFHPKDYGFDFYSDILFTMDDYAKKNPKIVQNFYKASKKGWEYAFSNIDETINIIKSKYDTQKIERDLLKFEANEFKKLAFFPDTPLGDINPIKLEKMVNTFKLLGDTNSTKNDFKEFIYAPNIYELIKLSFEEKGIKLEFGWSLFWQILSILAIIIIFILYKNIQKKKSEEQRLKLQVNEKTKDLKIALDEKELLLKELNHRVKNNMQTIVSLLRLQKDKANDPKLNDTFQTIESRINAMSHLHELLYTQDDIKNVDAYEYFEVLSNELKNSYNDNINISFNITTDLNIEQAIYCGIILNELVTNSFKYAFKNDNGEINISLTQKNSIYSLTISDNGIGYDQTKPHNSLGLSLVKRLVTRQLKGELNTQSCDGVKVDIKWKYYE